MLTKKYLKEAGIKFRQSHWRWMPPNYDLATSEFSEEGEFWSVDYNTYLGLWANRMNAHQSHIASTDERYIVIRHWLHDRWLITLVEILKEKE